MSELLIYIGKVVVIQAIFYGFYRLVLRNSVQHGLNRSYLLAALVFSFFIPFMQLPEQLPIQPLEESRVIVWLEESSTEFEMIPVEVQNESEASAWRLIPWMYILITLFLIGRSMVYLFYIKKLKKQSEYVKKQWFKLFKTSHTRPFSFFSNVFLPKDVFGSNAYDQILAHECVHVKQRHSIDRLLMDFLVSLFWFNPFIYLYRNALIEIHEFQADEAVINQFEDPIGYQEVLYSQLQHATYSGLVSHFNFSMIKKRIVMMNKQKHKYAGLLYALTLPVLVSVIFAFSSKEAIEPIEDVGHELADMLSPEPDFKFPKFKLPELKVQNNGTKQDDTVPSILPIREAGKVRMTSGYGMRNHPIYKVKKMHQGVDFACPMGSIIIAPADGVVKEVEANEEGYGNILTLEHSNGMATRYAQLSEFKVKIGDQVSKGDIIGLSGNSGASTAPHLHYEVKKDGKFVDPMDYIGDFKPRPVTKKGPSAKEEAQEELRNQQQAHAVQQGMMAKEEAERARLEESKANEMLQRASEEEKKAYQMQNEVQEQQLIEEKIRNEKLRLEDAKQGSTKEKRKEKVKQKTKSKDKDSRTDPRLGKVYEFLEGYEDDFDPDNWSIILKRDRVKLKRVGSLEGITLFNNAFEEKEKIDQKEILRNSPQAYRVIIDAGHGGKDSGAKSISGQIEKDIALTIAKMVQKEFNTDKQIELLLTREKDDFLELKQRVAMTESADLFISIHTDNVDGKGSFVLPVYDDQNEHAEESYGLAQTLAMKFKEVGKSTQVGYSSGYYLLNNAKCPSVLLNIAWFSDVYEDNYLASSDGQEQVARQIAGAIRTSVL